MQSLTLLPAALLLASVMLLGGVNAGVGNVLQYRREGRKLFYDMVITASKESPDCFLRDVILVNGMFQPTIIATTQDILVINVFNNLPEDYPQVTNGISLHWHGFDMWNNATGRMEPPRAQGAHGAGKERDGGSGGRRVDESPGTYFWHDHSGTNRADGLQGPLVVYLPKGVGIPYGPIEDERMLFMSDWYHTEAAILAKGLNRPLGKSATNNSGTYSWVGQPQSLLINGHGNANDCKMDIMTAVAGDNGYLQPVCEATSLKQARFKNQSGLQHKGCRRARLSVDYDKRYLIRLVNAATTSFLTVCFEGMRVMIIAADTTPIEYRAANCVDINTGQRKAGEAKRNYWISVTTQYADLAPAAYAVLSFKDGEMPPTPTPNPGTVPWTDQFANYLRSNDGVLGYLDNYELEVYWKSFTHGGSYGNGVLTPTPDKQIVLNTTSPSLMENGVPRWALNNVVSSVSPPCTSMMHDMLTEPDWLTTHTVETDLASVQKNNAALLGNSDAKGLPISVYVDGKPPPTIPALGINVIPIEFDSLVDIVVNNIATPDGSGINGRSTEQHPFHMHGHRFWILGSGVGFSGFCSDHGLGWVYIRFRSDNPGIWPFHCHIVWHEFMGQKEADFAGLNLRDAYLEAQRCQEERIGSRLQNLISDPLSDPFLQHEARAVYFTTASAPKDHEKFQIQVVETASAPLPRGRDSASGHNQAHHFGNCNSEVVPTLAFSDYRGQLSPGQNFMEHPLEEGNSDMGFDPYTHEVRDVASDDDSLVSDDNTELQVTTMAAKEAPAEPAPAKVNAGQPGGGDQPEAPISSEITDARTVTGAEPESKDKNADQTSKDIPEGAPSRHLWLGNIPLRPNKLAIEMLFGAFGAIDSVRVFPGKTFAFINYESVEDAIHAKETLDGQSAPAVISGNKPMAIRFQKDTSSAPGAGDDKSSGPASEIGGPITGKKTKEVSASMPLPKISADRVPEAVQPSTTLQKLYSLNQNNMFARTSMEQHLSSQERDRKLAAEMEAHLFTQSLSMRDVSSARMQERDRMLGGDHFARSSASLLPRSSAWDSMSQTQSLSENDQRTKSMSTFDGGRSQRLSTSSLTQASYGENETAFYSVDFRGGLASRDNGRSGLREHTVNAPTDGYYSDIPEPVDGQRRRSMLMNPTEMLLRDIQNSPEMQSLNMGNQHLLQPRNPPCAPVYRPYHSAGMPTVSALGMGNLPVPDTQPSWARARAQDKSSGLGLGDNQSAQMLLSPNQQTQLPSQQVNMGGMQLQTGYQGGQPSWPQGSASLNQILPSHILRASNAPTMRQQHAGGVHEMRQHQAGGVHDMGHQQAGGGHGIRQQQAGGVHDMRQQQAGGLHNIRQQQAGGLHGMRLSQPDDLDSGFHPKYRLDNQLPNLSELSQEMPMRFQAERAYPMHTMSANMANLQPPVLGQYVQMGTLPALPQMQGQEFLCPLTGFPMTDPVMAADGMTYEK
eukprot:gene1752-33161_t